MISTIRTRHETDASKAAKNGRRETINFIVTGFNSFGKNLENPSGLAAQSLPSELVIGDKIASIQRLLLETCCTSSWSRLKRALQVGRGEKTVLILLGLAARREELNLERLALNVRDYPIRDNRGHRYDGVPIADGPLALQTDFPLRDLRKKLNSRGFPCIISNYTGTFVCNDIYYQSLSLQQRTGHPDLCLFIHLPKRNVFAKAVRKKNSPRLRDYVSARMSKERQGQLLNLAIIETIKFCVGYLSEED